MKKIKFYERLKRKRKTKKPKTFLIKVCLYFTTFIIVILLLLFVIFKFRKNEIKEQETISPNEIMYKGSKILKIQLIEDYFSRISIDEQNKDNERNILNKLFNLSEYSNEPNEKNKYKNVFLNFFSKIKNKKMNKVETLFLDDMSNFGNCIVKINNIIFDCEIVGCHTIIINAPHSLIKNPIYIKKLNITIIPSSEINCTDEFTLCKRNYFDPIFVKSQIRTQYLKEEIMRNIPKVNIDPNALYINLRGGDIFSSPSNTHYSQPPLCFYEKIINNNKFSNIYIISNDRQNVVLDALINKYNNIIFRHDNYESDIASLVQASNVVASISSFFFAAIKFNDNLKNLWEYDILRLCEKFLWLHHHLYKLDIKYKIYTMKPSDIYLNQLFIWRASPNQLKLMIEAECPNDFILTKPNQ